MRIGEICTREVVFCEPDASVAEVARLMRNHHVGDLIVAEKGRVGLEPVGLVTDRDLVVKVLAEGVAAETLKAADLMTRRVVTALEATDVHEAIERMRNEGVRRLPVVDASGALVGVLSVDDVSELLAEELTALARIPLRQSALERAVAPPLKD
jgi:CBS domain-containing protein